MLRFQQSQDGHTVILLPPQDINGGKTSAAFALKLYRQASITVAIGASTGAPGPIVVNACSNAAGAGAVAIPYDLYACETVNGDLLTTRLPQTAAGYIPPATSDIFYVIELRAELLPQNLPYVQLVLNNGAHSVFAAAVAVLSGSRYQQDQSPTVLI